MQPRKTREQIIDEAYARYARCDIQTLMEVLGVVYDAAMKQAREQRRRATMKKGRKRAK